MAALRSGLAQAFVINKEKRLIAENGPAQRTAKLVIVERVLRVRLGVEKIARVERVIAEILEPAAVKLVGATLGDDVDDRTGVAPVLRFVIGEHPEFGHRFDGKNGGRRAEDPGLIDGRVIAVAVVHVGAVQQEVVRAAASPVH